VLRRPDGRDVQFAADGIALSPDGRTLYWQAVKGATLYSAPTAALRSTRLSAGQIAARVRAVGRNGVADGLLIDGAGRMYVTSPEDNSVKVRNGTRAGLQGGSQLSTLAASPALRWPDTFALGPDGTLYVTTSRIQDSAFFHPENGPRIQTQLWSLGRVAGG
jgi:sugar lactone lactonase YvrE